MSSFGDFIALSEVCDETTANIIKREVSDGVIAPGYTPEALTLLKTKRNGAYAVLKIDPAYEPEAMERKQVFGVTFEQPRNTARIDGALLYQAAQGIHSGRREGHPVGHGLRSAGGLPCDRLQGGLDRR